MIVLGTRPFRSVVLCAAPDAHEGRAVVSKRFHHPNPLLALFDGARARREFAALVALERAGLPVPKPLGVRATETGWELELAAVADARSLRALFDREHVPPGGWARLAARLGALLARLQQHGWEHGDLHPGNVLIDGSGAPWLIDLGAARRGAPDAARSLSEVVHCAAVARELLPARVRARFLVAWLRALPRELRPQLRGAGLARALEQRARLRRRHQVRLGLGRWLRESSRVRRVVLGGTSAWLRRDLPDAVLSRTATDWLTLRGPAAELRERWLGAARLHEHRLPVARPAVFVPAAGRGVHGAWAAFEPPPPEDCAESSTALLALLAERGLALAPGAPGPAHSGAGVYLRPPREPADLMELEDSSAEVQRPAASRSRRARP